jgi:hypothetical protein
MYSSGIILAVLVSQIAASSLGASKILIFDAGLHCRRDLVQPQGGGWFAICQIGGRTKLVGVRARMRSATAERAGRIVRTEVAGCSTPLLLIKGSVFQDGDVEDADLQPKGFSFRGREYWLTMNSNGRLPAVWVLLTGTEGPSPIIGRSRAVQIRWAGDLNRDGKPDLVVDDEHRRAAVTLWLSTGTTPNAQLLAVAEAPRSLREGSLTQACSGRADARR